LDCFYPSSFWGVADCFFQPFLSRSLFFMDRRYRVISVLVKNNIANWNNSIYYFKVPVGQESGYSLTGGLSSQICHEFVVRLLTRVAVSSNDSSVVVVTCRFSWWLLSWLYLYGLLEEDSVFLAGYQWTLWSYIINYPHFLWGFTVCNISIIIDNEHGSVLSRKGRYLSDSTLTEPLHIMIQVSLEYKRGSMINLWNSFIPQLVYYQLNYKKNLPDCVTSSPRWSPVIFFCLWVSMILCSLLHWYCVVSHIV
jgi:hypothetical protein